jgi:hypothetical protein
MRGSNIEKSQAFMIRSAEAVQVRLDIGTHVSMIVERVAKSQLRILIPCRQGQSSFAKTTGRLGHPNQSSLSEASVPCRDICNIASKVDQSWKIVKFLHAASYGSPYASTKQSDLNALMIAQFMDGSMETGQHDITQYSRVVQQYGTEKQTYQALPHHKYDP